MLTPFRYCVHRCLWLGLLAGCAGDDRAIDAAALAATTVPAAHAAGARLFAARCAVCHGAHGIGTEQGPALLHLIYRPAHHGDESFQLAVAQGVRAHHWRFGDMPAVEGITREEVTAIVGYVRWLQREAGIE